MAIEATKSGDVPEGEVTEEGEVEPRRGPLAVSRPEQADSPPEHVLPSTSPDAQVDRGPEVVATTLAPQLGSDTTHLGRGNFDMRKLSVITEKDIPILMYAHIRGKKTPVWDTIYDMYLNLQVSVGGRGRRDIIRMEGVSKGGLPDFSPELEKPGWIARNFTDRKWKQRAQDEMV